MRSLRILLVWLCACGSQELGRCWAQESTGKVANILGRRCLACHDDKKREGRFVLSNFQKLQQAGDSGKVPVIAGQPEKSELYRRLVTQESADRMPLDAEPLTSAEIEVIGSWIREGAPVPSGAESRPLSAWMASPSGVKTPATYPTVLPISALAIHPDGKSLMVNGYGELTQWDIEKGRLLRRLPVAGETVADVDVSSDGKYLAISSGKPGIRGVVTVLEMRPEGDPLELWSESLGDVAADLAFAPDSHRLAIAHTDGSLAIVELSDANDSPPAARSQRFVPHADAISSVAWSASGNRMMTGSRDRTAKIYDASGMQLIANYDRHQRAVGGVAYLGENPVSFDETGQLRIWSGDDNDRSIAERDNLARFLQHIVAFDKTIYVTQESDIRTFVIDKSTVEDGKDESGKVKTKTVTRIHETDRLLSSGKDWILRLAIQKDWIVAGTECGEILVWDRTQNQPKHRFVAKP